MAAVQPLVNFEFQVTLAGVAGIGLTIVEGGVIVNIGEQGSAATHNMKASSLPNLTPIRRGDVVAAISCGGVRELLAGTSKSALEIRELVSKMSGEIKLELTRQVDTDEWAILNKSIGPPGTPSKPGRGSARKKGPASPPPPPPLTAQIMEQLALPPTMKQLMASTVPGLSSSSSPAVSESPFGHSSLETTPWSSAVHAHPAKTPRHRHNRSDSYSTNEPPPNLQNTILAIAAGGPSGVPPTAGTHSRHSSGGSSAAMGTSSASSTSSLATPPASPSMAGTVRAAKIAPPPPPMPQHSTADYSGFSSDQQYYQDLGLPVIRDHRAAVPRQSYSTNQARAMTAPHPSPHSSGRNSLYVFSSTPPLSPNPHHNHSSSSPPTPLSIPNRAQSPNPTRVGLFGSTPRSGSHSRKSSTSRNAPPPPMGGHGHNLSISAPNSAPNSPGSSMIAPNPGLAGAVNALPALDTLAVPGSGPAGSPSADGSSAALTGVSSAPLMSRTLTAHPPRPGPSGSPSTPARSASPTLSSFFNYFRQPSKHAATTSISQLPVPAAQPPASFHLSNTTNSSSSAVTTTNSVSTPSLPLSIATPPAVATVTVPQPSALSSSAVGSPVIGTPTAAGGSSGSESKASPRPSQSIPAPSSPSINSVSMASPGGSLPGSTPSSAAPSPLSTSSTISSPTGSASTTPTGQQRGSASSSAPASLVPPASPVLAPHSTNSGNGSPTASSPASFTLPAATRAPAVSTVAHTISVFGMHLEEAKAKDGLRVMAVNVGDCAARVAGFRQNDVITHAGGRAVNSLTQITTVLQRVKPKEKLTFSARRPMVGSVSLSIVVDPTGLQLRFDEAPVGSSSASPSLGPQAAPGSPSIKGVSGSPTGAGSKPEAVRQPTVVSAR